jgi:hypothetical protein
MTTDTRRLPFEVVCYSPEQAPAWIIQHWDAHRMYPAAALQYQQFRRRLRVAISHPTRPWIGQPEHFVVGVRWMVMHLLDHVTVDANEVITLPSDEQEFMRQPCIGVSYSEVPQPAGELTTGEPRLVSRDHNLARIQAERERQSRSWSPDFGRPIQPERTLDGERWMR